jgi:hypothetical protein
VKVSQEEFERRLAYVQALEIGHGSHDAPAVNGPASGQACVMEMVAYVAGEPWSDHPKCACPVITSFLIRWNDDLPDADRTRLIKPLIPKVADTRSTKAVEERRSFMALDWLIREHTPAWLGLVPALAQHVDVLKALGEVCDMDSATAAGNAVRAAQKDADAAWAAARDAAWDAARAAARDAAWAAARDAAWDAARAAARDAAWAAARDAARDAAWAAARDAAWDAARAAARDAAWDAAWERLKPTKEALQLSALQLVERMIEVKPGRRRGP